MTTVPTIHHRDRIAGRTVRPALVLDGPLEDPNTGAAIGERRQSAPAAVDDALAAADALDRSGAWRRTAPDDRAAALERLASALERRADEVGPLEARETGVPIAITRVIAANLGGIVRGAIAQLCSGWQYERRDTAGRRVDLRRVPFGPVAVMTPWNAPAWLGTQKAAYALAAGCPVILKPSEWASSSANLLADAVEEADLPAAVFQLVHGDGRVGGQLASDPRIRAIAFTGGQVAGRAVAAVAAPNMTALQLELGGSNAAIVRADADVALTARELARGITKLNGQWCEGPGRIVVGNALHDELRDALAAELAVPVVGSSLDQRTDVGPMANRAQYDRLRGRLRALGGDQLAPAALPGGDGFFVSPTVVTGVDARSVGGEIFGPVVTMHRAHDDADALELANDGGDGLAAYVFSRDEEAALALGAELRAGEVKINGTGLLDLCPGSTQAFFGASGIGAHGDAELFRFFCGARIVGVDDTSAPI